MALHLNVHDGPLDVRGSLTNDWHVVGPWA